MLVRKRVGKSEHYFSTLTNLPVEFYAMLMDKINIRRYLSDMTDPVWAGNDTVTIFAKSDGMRSLNLPEGITARGIIGPFRGTVSNGEEFQVHANQSYIFLLEKK